MITHLKGVSDSLTSFQRRLFDQLCTNPYRKHQQQNWKKTFHMIYCKHSTNTVNFLALSKMSTVFNSFFDDAVS